MKYAGGIIGGGIVTAARARRKTGYRLHDKDHYLEFVFGMWMHTWDIVGPPTVREVRITLAAWPRARQLLLIEILKTAKGAA